MATADKEYTDAFKEELANFLVRVQGRAQARLDKAREEAEEEARQEREVNILNTSKKAHSTDVLIMFRSDLGLAALTHLRFWRRCQRKSRLPFRRRTRPCFVKALASSQRR